MEIAVLTSSRADFGFYKPLLNLLAKEQNMNARLIVFGTHLSVKYGLTKNDIIAQGYTIFSEVDVQPAGDSPENIAYAIGTAHIKFASFWKQHHFDLIICLGDRYEMFAAVSASVPFNIPVAHISGGEETNGAIDNVYRHTLSLMASYHFTNTQKNAQRVKQITGYDKNIFYTGSMAIDNIKQTELLTNEQFNKAFKFDLSTPYILFTFHPETIDYKRNISFATTIREVLTDLDMNVLVTMPNADTMGDVIREELYKAAKNSPNIFLFESLGSQGYYTALKNCVLVLGNSSSGIVEAASFSKYVINIGNRQAGREFGHNVFHCEIDSIKIMNQIQILRDLPAPINENIYGDGQAAERIVSVLSEIFKGNNS